MTGLEVLTLALLLPPLYSWLSFIALDQPVIWVCIFTGSEILPAILKYRKLKEVLEEPKETIENPIYK